MKELNKEQQRLVLENLELAKQLAWYFGKIILSDRHEKSITMDDLEQEATEGLIEASIRYDSALNVDFGACAYIWIRKFVLRAMRKFGTSLSVPCNFEGGVELLHLDMMMEDVASSYASDDDDGSPADRLFYEVALAEDAERDAQKEREALVKRMLEGLTAKERKVLVCLFALEGEEMDRIELANMMGITPNRVSQLKERVLRKLEIAA